MSEAEQPVPARPASAPRHGVVDALPARAGDGLYQAEQAGRNRVVAL